MNRKLNKFLKNISSFLYIIGVFFIVFGAWLSPKDNIVKQSINKFLAGLNIYTEEIKKVEIESNDYDEPGSWHIDKSAKWTGLGTAQVTFDVKSVMKTTERNKDVILVLDVSGSMSGDKLDRVKSDSKDLVELLLSDSNNKVALITFESTSEILSGFSNNKEDLLNKIDSLTDKDSTNYNAGLLNVDSIMKNYQRQNNRDVVTLFLTDGYPNVDTPNQIATYELLKDKYPYMAINGIQYEMGQEIVEEIKQISDNQWKADMETLNNVLFEASISPIPYDKYEIVDYIHDDYFYIESEEDIDVSRGSVRLEEEDGLQKIVWTLDNNVTGFRTKMNINLKLKEQYVGSEGYYPTNKKEVITSKVQDENEKEVNSTKTPVLKTNYNVIYETNTPSGCTLENIAAEPHFLYSNVTKKQDKLSCYGYLFKGWEIIDKDVQKINDDVFIMPPHDVTIRAIWSKQDIVKSMDGTVYENKDVTVLYEDGTLIINEDDRTENMNKHGDVIKEYEGFSKNNKYVFNDLNSQLWKNERNSIKSVEIGKEIQPTSTAYWFSDLKNMENGDFKNLDTSKVTNMGSMFSNAGYNSTTFELEGLSNWDISKVTNMSSMFYGVGNKATSLSIGDLSDWDTSRVTNMSRMFQTAASSAATWSIGDLSGWNTSQVTDMSFMFSAAGKNVTTFDIGNLANWDTSKVMNMRYMFALAGYKATTWSIGDLSDWDTSQVTDMTCMFDEAGYSAITFNLGDLSNWDTSQVTTMFDMFDRAGYSATTWTIGNLSNWDTSKVTSMFQMFLEAGYKANNFSLDLSNWDTSSVTDMSSMFGRAGYSATTFNIGNLSNWNTSQVTKMYSMFQSAGYSATTWSVGNLSNWNTSQVTKMYYMFLSAGYNATTWSIGDLSSWDTSSVTDMSSMFSSAGYNATTFNIGNLSNWDTSKVTSMSGMFYYTGYSATTFNIGDLSGWDTSKVTSMSGMFSSAGYSATTWSIGDLSDWDTSSVTNMYSMFASAGQSATTWSIGDLSDWDTSSVTNMQSMFGNAGRSATNFNIGNLSDWNTSSVENMSYMFTNVGYSATTWTIGNLSNWDTSKVKNMSGMFASAGHSVTAFQLDLSNWNTSSVTTMSKMFSSTGENATTFNLGDLSNWDTSKVTNMSEMFSRAGYNATTWNSVGTLKVYANNIYQMFYKCSKAKATLNIYSNPFGSNSGYNQAFHLAATDSSALITVNYSSTTTRIDNIIATKSSDSNVVKGTLLD